jgi:DNA-binding NarL/FixJ family response regulator
VAKFDFTKSEYQFIVEECMFNDELKEIFELLIKNYSRTQIAMKLNMSERTLDKRIRVIKNKIKKIL